MYVQPKFIPVNILNIQITMSKNIPPHRREVFVGGDDNESFDSSRFVLIRQHFQTPIADTCVSCKLTSCMRFHVIRDGFSDFRYHITTKPRIDLRFEDSSTAFDDSPRFGCIGQPSPLDGVF